MSALVRPILLFVLLALPAVTLSQSVSGYLYDDQHQPLVGGNILLLGTNTGAATNSDGFYSLRVSHGRHRIVASFMGYQNDTFVVSVNTYDHLKKNF